MRVIAGKHKGRRLATVKDRSVRPATGRTKGAIFNMLQHRLRWDEVTVLDLFAGSGSLGIEALSRGARHAIFVENARPAIRFLKQNVALVGAEHSAEIVEEDVFRYLRRMPRPCTLVFADPPYALETLPGLPTQVIGSGAVDPSGYLIIEHPASTLFTPDAGWKEILRRSYGRTVVSIFQPTPRTSR